MGSFYTNVTLRGPAQEEVLAHLGDRAAYVSRTSDSFTVVLDEASESQDLDELLGVTASLSTHFDSPALAALNHDNSVLYLSLFEHGQQVDQYNSCPEFDNEDADEESSGPAGGDAARWVAAFGGDASALERALHGTEFVSATERHAAVVAALGMPPFAVGIGYNYVEADDVGPDAADAADIAHAARRARRAGAAGRGGARGRLGGRRLQLRHHRFDAAAVDAANIHRVPPKCLQRAWQECPRTGFRLPE